MKFNFILSNPPFNFGRRGKREKFQELTESKSESSVILGTFKMYKDIKQTELIDVATIHNWLPSCHSPLAIFSGKGKTETPDLVRIDKSGAEYLNNPDYVAIYACGRIFVEKGKLPAEPILYKEPTANSNFYHKKYLPMIYENWNQICLDTFLYRFAKDSCLLIRKEFLTAF